MNYRLKPIEEITVEKLLAHCGLGDLSSVGDLRSRIWGLRYVRPFEEAEAGCLAFLYVKKDPVNAADRIRNSNATLVITETAVRAHLTEKPNQVVVFADNAKLTVVKILNALCEEVSPAFLPPGQIPSSTYLGPNVVIEDNCTIGENCRLVGNIYIYSNTTIGNNVVIKPGAVIGGQGFGYVNDNGRQVLFPHIGGVVIEDEVRVGSSTCIDRGALGNTVLKQGCRIDNLVHIAHNVVVGRNSLVIANAMVAGSVTIGDNSWVSPSASILDGISIGNEAMIGLASCVLKSVPDNTVVYGVPARAKTK